MAGQASGSTIKTGHLYIRFNLCTYLLHAKCIDCFAHQLSIYECFMQTFTLALCRRIV